MARPLTCLEGWLIALRLQNCSPKTLYKNELITRKFLEAINRQEIEDIAVDDVRRYLAQRMSGVSAITAESDRRVLTAFFNFLLREEVIEKSPMAKIYPIHLTKKIIPTLPVEIIEQLLKCCNDKTFLGARNKAIILVLLDTGVRRSELIGIQKDDLYREAIVVHGKGAKERYIRISPRTQKVIWKYLLHRRDDLPHLWLTEERRPLKSDAIRLMIQRLTQRAGVNSYKVSAHIFRHTYATEMLRLGVDERSLQAFLGHSTSAMTRRYTEQFNSLDALKLHQVSPVEAMNL